jgi:hypothetical protein
VSNEISYLVPRRGCCLVDLLVTRGGVDRADRDRGANILELEVVSRRSVLDDGDLTLRVAGVARKLGAHTLVGVVTTASDGAPSWLTCAMAGATATASMANSAANNINFFNSLSFSFVFFRTWLRTGQT